MSSGFVGISVEIKSQEVGKHLRRDTTQKEARSFVFVKKRNRSEEVKRSNEGTVVRLDFNPRHI